ncbi:MAG TPA: Gldg family protein [Myxococcota bacterium]|jgi:hypothetical protein|nr:Gldg family protein [Myxococcota bacterium]
MALSTGPKSGGGGSGSGSAGEGAGDKGAGARGSRALQTATRLIPLAAAALATAAVSVPAHLLFSKATGPVFIGAKLLAGAAVGVVAWYLARAYTLQAAGGSRTALAGALAWIGAIAAFVLVVEANYISSRHWARFDWTSTAFYSLSDKGVATLKDMKKAVHATVFLSPRSEAYADIFKDTEELLAQMQDQNPLFTVEFVDPDRDIEKAKILFAKYKLPPDVDSVVVFECGAAPDAKTKYVSAGEMADYDYGSGGDMAMGPPPKRLAAFKGEQAFVSAILEVTSDVQTQLCFVKGHGEASSTVANENSLSELTEGLTTVEALKTEEVDLMAGAIPAACTVLVVAGPQTPYLPAETAKIGDYLDKGGRLLAMFDPPLGDPTSGPRVKTGFEELLAKWGVTLERAVAFDPENLLAAPGAEGLEALALRVVEWSDHAIVKPFNGMFALMRLARPVVAMNPPPAGLEVAELMHTSKDGWGERGTLTPREIGPDPDDVKGPVPLAVAVDAPTRGGARLVVFGNSRFASNALSGAGINSDLFVNTVRWLTKKESLISIAPKTPESVTIDLSEKQLNLALVSCAALMLLGIAVGFVVRGVRRTG